MSNHWRNDLRLKLEDLVDSLIVNGAKQSEVYQAIKDEIDGLEAAYERDPDPAEDDPKAEVDEPSNDWPASQL